MTVQSLQSLIGHGPQASRVSNDFYPTPDRGIYSLLDNETFDGEIWEPACGEGAISKILKRRGYDNVYSTDLVDRGYGDGFFDFMSSRRPTDNIITNPPFNIGTKFTLHALNLAQKKVAILNKLTFLEGKERRDKLFSQRNLETVYVFSERLSFGSGHKGGMLAFAWFVFNKEYYGDAKIKFI